MLQPPNYTQVPNEIMDIVMRKYADKPHAIVVLLAICRKTIGWHKTSDIISYSQLREMTGYGRPVIAKMTMLLSKDGYITITSTKGKEVRANQGAAYSFDLNMDKIKNQLPGITGSSQLAEVTSNPGLSVPVIGDYRTDNRGLLTKDNKDTKDNSPHSAPSSLEENTQSSPAKVLADWVLNEWYPSYGKAARKNLLVQGLYEGVPELKTLSTEQALDIKQRMIEHTKWYRSTTELQFQASPVNYLKDRKWEEDFKRQAVKKSNEDFAKAGGQDFDINKWVTYKKD